MSLQIDCPPTHNGSAITICGEAPGEEEVKRGEGFVGAAGEVLDAVLRHAGLSRKMVNLTNVAKRRPKGNDFKAAFYETAEIRSKPKKPGGKGRAKKVVQPTAEYGAYVELLRQEIETTHPNVVVAAGSEALRALTGIGSGIINYRGSILESTLVPGVKVIPIIHPAAILHSRQWSEVYVSGRIMREKVVPESKRAELVRRTYEVRPVDTLIDVLAFMEWIEQWGVRWSLDIETPGGSIACFAIAAMGEVAPVTMCVPIQTTTGPRWTPEEERQIWEALADLMAHNGNLVGHNIVYDLDWLAEKGCVPSGVYMDTMLAFHALYPESARDDDSKGGKRYSTRLAYGLRKSLWFLTMLYDDMPYYKHEGKITTKTPNPNEQLWSYNIKDAVTTLRCSYGLDRELAAASPGVRMQEKLLRDLIPVALEMMRNGLAVDLTEINTLRWILQGEYGRVYDELRVEVGPDLNLNSPKQVQALLYDTLGLPVKRKRGGGRTTDEDALTELGLKHPDVRALTLLRKERHLNKAIRDYVNVRLLDAT